MPRMNRSRPRWTTALAAAAIALAVPGIAQTAAPAQPASAITHDLAKQSPPPAAGASIIVPGTRPDSPPALGPLSGNAQEVTVVARDLLLHVEALEVILGAQAAAQKTATAAAGGAVVSYETVTGSTRTTVTGTDVTLNAGQMSDIKTHLQALRRLLGKDGGK
jgi:hypothetical protein